MAVKTKAPQDEPAKYILERALTAKDGFVKAGSSKLLADVDYYISTQAAYVDYAIGRPGVPAGKVTTIMGREASGKSTIGYHLLAETQARGGIGVLIDSEQRFPRERAGLLGIRPDELIVVDGATLEESFAKIEDLAEDIRKHYLDIPVLFDFDSLAGAVPKKRMEEELDKIIMAPAARFVSATLPRIKLKMAGARMALVIINQLRSRIGGLDPTNPSTYERIKVMGKSQTMLAEWPLIFESALMLYVHSVSNTGPDKDHPTGLKSRVVVRKCGIAPREMWKAEVEIDYLTGIDKVGSKFDLLLALKYLAAKGSRFELAGANEPSFYKKEFYKVLEKHPELAVLCEEAPTLWVTGNEPKLGEDTEFVLEDEEV